MAGPRSKGKAKRKSVDDDNDEVEVPLAASSAPPARKKTRSDTVTQAPPGRTSSRVKVTAQPRAAPRTPGVPPPPVISEPDESSTSSSSSPPPDTPTESNTGNSARAASLDASSARNSSRSTAANDVWHFFEKGNKKSNTKSVCRVCVKNIAADFAKYGKINHKYAPSSGISNLRLHIESHHADEYVRLCVDNNWTMMLPKLRAAEEQSGQNPSVLSADPSQLPFSAKNFLRALVKFIVADDQSLNVLECREFRNLLVMLREGLRDRDIPHRTKIREAIIVAWKEYFASLKLELAAAVGKISFTGDLWSDSNLRPFLALMAHWLGRDTPGSPLLLKTALFAFHNVMGKHDGKNLADISVRLMDRAGMTANVGHFTLDNASNNGTWMEELEHILSARDIPFDAADNRIMCFPHVIQICCDHMMASITNIDLADAAVEFVVRIPSTDPDKQTFEEAVKRDPIALGRAVVRSIRASGQRRQNFHDTIEDGNDKHWFGVDDDGEYIVMPFLQLLRDVKTRWDSVYGMISRLREMRPAVDHFLAQPMNKDVAKHALSDTEWKVLQDFELILSVPHRCQQTMSREKTPVLSGSIPAFEMMMGAWTKLTMSQPKLKPFIDVALSWAEKYYAKTHRTKAYIIAMFINPCVRLSWMKKHWSATRLKAVEQTILATMREYHDRAKDTISPDTPSSSRQSSSLQPEKWQTLDQQYGLEDMYELEADHEGQTIEQEYHSYVTGLSKPGTDIIKFWDVSESTHPTIFAVAIDYIPIQASSVPSERVFSSSGETDTAKRNRMSPILMEALQMLKFGIKQNRLNFTNGWITDEKSMEVDEYSEADYLANLLGEDSADAMDELLAAVGDADDDAMES